MKKLLKDMPEHMERIENNYVLIDKIKDIVETESTCCLTENIVFQEDPPIPHSIGDNITDYSTIDNGNAVAELIIKELTDHVNENYTFGADLAKEFDRGYKEGQDDYEEENPPINEEKLCTEYVVEKFGDCNTLAEFTEVYNELRNISYTHMN